MGTEGGMEGRGGRGGRTEKGKGETPRRDSEGETEGGREQSREGGRKGLRELASVCVCVGGGG